ncbi:MAG: glycosyltransferase [Pseudomonadota bacterium]
MRILYIGSTSPTACASYYADAAEKLGHLVFRFDPHLFECNSLLERVRVKLTKTPLKRNIFSAQEAVIRQCQSQNIDVILNLAENFLSVDFLETIKGLPHAPKIIYHSHDNNFSSGILKPNDFFESLSLYDCVFTTKSQNLQRYKMLGQQLSFFIPSAFEPRVHRPIPSSESKLGAKHFAISFVGTYDHSRDKFLKALDWEQLYVWGDRWKRYGNYRKYRTHIIPHAIYYPDFADILSHSKVTLGLLREEAQDKHTQRTFEIPACGAFQIAPRNDEILSFFEEDEEIVCFETVDELKEKVSFYLKNETERNRIAKKGYQRVLKSGHTYMDRIKTMLEKLSLT